MSRFETFDSFIDLEALSEMDIKADNLSPIYKEIAEKIGLENTLILYNEFRGSQVHFGTSLFSKDFIHQSIIKEYKEQHISAAKLASKYHLSERTVKWILQSQNDTKSNK
jgi:AraC-like DNA-binding protein